MSSRFHNKYHRHNHHTTPINDPRYPDASHDPIASHHSPFLGPFVLLGTLSANNNSELYSSHSGAPAGVFTSKGTALLATSLTGIALSAEGDIYATGALSAASIHFTGNIIQTYTAPITATGDFLEIKIGNTTKAIRLWNI